MNRYGALRWLWLLLIAMRPAFGASVAATGDAVLPDYKPLRYDEDYSYLAGRGIGPADPDAIKYIPFGPADVWWLTLGGEARLRYEYYSNYLWSGAPQDNDGFFLQRLRFHADAHFGASVRVFAQIKDDRGFGRTDGPRPVDEDRLDLSQAFFDWNVPLANRGIFTARIGREELGFGSYRLISPEEGPNVKQSFDGFRGILRLSGTTLDLFAVKPVLNRPAAVDDKADSHKKLWGAYATVPCTWLPGSKVDIYYIGLQREAGTYNQGTAREERHSFGTRLWGSRDAWDYDLEFVYQLGRFGIGQISAWAIASDTGYTFRQAVLRPRVGLKVHLATGDRNTGDARLEAFNPLYPRMGYFNDSALIGTSNFIDFQPAVELHLDRWTKVLFDCGFFWRESTRDGLYGPAVNLLRSGLTTNARYIGSQPSVRLERKVSRHWTAVMAYARFIAGPFLQESGPAPDIDYFVTTAIYKF